MGQQSSAEAEDCCHWLPHWRGMGSPWWLPHQVATSHTLLYGVVVSRKTRYKGMGDAAAERNITLQYVHVPQFPWNSVDVCARCCMSGGAEMRIWHHVCLGHHVCLRHHVCLTLHNLFPGAGTALAPRRTCWSLSSCPQWYRPARATTTRVPRAT